ncbi:MAG: hypothetical protein H6838_02405 [Planctomycetes bacterium]|nr:hypothetical protein [Planctomycetota bacterium]MCB9884312.1 hypothetical protein [Planctomycetota bacterium]
MNQYESTARARHLTAILEEAVGERVGTDLADRIAQRLTATPPRPSWRPFLIAACMVAGAAVVFAVATQPPNAREKAAAGSSVVGAQDPVRAAQDPVVAAPVITLSLQRVQESGDPAAPPRSRVVWRIGEKELQTIEALRTELARLAKDPSLRRPDPEHAGRSEPPRLVIQPAVGTQWNDLVAATDAAIAAPFTDIRFAGVDTTWLVPKAVAPAGDGLVLPKAEFSEPDDDPHAARPTINLFADGRIEYRGEVWFRPDAKNRDDLESVARHLRALRAELVTKGLLDEQHDAVRAGLRVPILVRVDVGTEWSHVQRLLRMATAKDVGFWKIEFAVAEPSRPK